MPELIEEVYDLGDRLKFVKKDTEQVVKLKDIESIKYGFLKSPLTIVVNTHTTGFFGKKLVFVAPIQDSFTMSSLVSDLYDRIDAEKERLKD
ncbi:MAG: hypothetical protein BalsKO_30270 [Balneolaceae bacterium]